ncbi:MAG: hypothetical protein IJM35_01125 [Bacteroidales bacterium]|nr:hypothetical protein [Bacteroidales bacterium]
MNKEFLIFILGLSISYAAQAQISQMEPVDSAVQARTMAPPTAKERTVPVKIKGPRPKIRNGKKIMSILSSNKWFSHTADYTCTWSFSANSCHSHSDDLFGDSSNKVHDAHQPFYLSNTPDKQFDKTKVERLKGINT